MEAWMAGRLESLNNNEFEYRSLRDPDNSSRPLWFHLNLCENLGVHRGVAVQIPIGPASNQFNGQIPRKVPIDFINFRCMIKMRISVELNNHCHVFFTIRRDNHSLDSRSEKTIPKHLTIEEVNISRDKPWPSILQTGLSKHLQHINQNVARSHGKDWTIVVAVLQAFEVINIGGVKAI